MSIDQVTAWAERITIPTYGIGAPNRNPMFLEKRVYQGSSGAVYPLPVVDQVFDERTDQAYTVLFLENRYLKIMILPALGGRVQMALDKTNDYHFVYYNRVIKPALVGLAGPWISGGIEFNWPQHHRPTTYLPMEWRIERNADGSQTIWCTEIEPMFHTQGSHGFTLRPDCAVLEVSAQLYNRSDTAQTFLWWANPAVAVNEQYQTVFPPDVTAVMDHGKRDVSAFPIAKGVYYKHDYAPGKDIRWYKNIPVPTSYMAYQSAFDFVGGYDHGREAGMLHIADHHISPGKKMWTWGAGDFGAAWNRHLTDEDGPYIELMCGVYTDNQPDFSWIQPGEERRFTQYFLPYKLIGPPRNASRAVLLHLETTVDAGRALADVGVYVTSPRSVRVLLCHETDASLDAAPLYDAEHFLAPEAPLRMTLPFNLAMATQALRLQVFCEGRLLLECSTQRADEQPLPEPASAAPAPGDVASNEELYLHGVHLEQYRHATWDAAAYYREALRRDPLDVRCNNALGLRHYRAGEFAAAEACFRNAIARLTLRNPNPREGEPFYNLGLALRMQGRFAEAYEAFFKATWSHAWQAAAYFELARIASRSGEVNQALEFLEQTLAVNAAHHKARALQTALLGAPLGTPLVADGAQAQARDSAGSATAGGELDNDALGTALASGGSGLQQAATLQQTPGNSIDLALDLAHAGLFDAALARLHQASRNPMHHYLRGWINLQKGDEAAARKDFAQAAALPIDYCFPNRGEEMLALEAVRRAQPADANAAWALGNFYYGHRRHEDAVVQWEAACALDESFATAQRNLGLAYVNVRGDLAAALVCYERACALDRADARLLLELDQLRRRMNLPPAERLRQLEAQRDLVLQRDDLTIEYVTLLNLAGEHDTALAVIAGRRFHPWEGGEGKVTAQYAYALAAQAEFALRTGDPAQAIALLDAARKRPDFLGEGKLAGTRENDIHYLLGCAYRAAADKALARTHFMQATEGADTPALALAYNDQPPEMLYYQGLALRALGREQEAQARFSALLDYGTAHASDVVTIDYFAVSLPEFSLFAEPIDLRHRIHCQYMIGLGALGLEERAGATAAFAAVLALDASHQGAIKQMRALAAQSMC